MDRELFKYYVKKLLANSFITIDSSPEAYKFIMTYSSEIEDVLKPIGFTLNIDENIKVISVFDDTGENTVNLSKNQTVVALTLCILFNEKEGITSSDTYRIVTLEDIINGANDTKSFKISSKGEFIKILKFFKKYNIVDFESEDKLKNSMSSEITIFSSISHLVDLQDKRIQSLIETINKEKNNETDNSEEIQDD